jgi:hypothetical protein
VTAQVACRIDALNGEAGQILHRFPPGAPHRGGPPSQLKQILARIVARVSVWCQEKMLQDIGVPLQNSKMLWKCTGPASCYVDAGLRPGAPLRPVCRGASAVLKSSRPIRPCPTVVLSWGVRAFGGTTTAVVWLAALRPASLFRDCFQRRGASSRSRLPAIRRGALSRDPVPAACR